MVVYLKICELEAMNIIFYNKNVKAAIRDR